MRELMKIGSITTTKGLKGEFKVYALDEELYYLEVGDQIFIEGIFENLYIDQVKSYNELVVLKLKGYNTLDKIKTFKAKNVFIDVIKAKLEISEDIAIEDLIGFKVIDEKDNSFGEIIDIIGSKAQAVLVIKNGENEWMLPYVEQFIVEVNETEHKIIVELIEGMVE